MLGRRVEQHAVVEGLQHGLHGVHRPHQPHQLSRDVVDGAGHRPAQRRRRGGAARAAAVVGNPGRRRVCLDAAARAAVCRGDGFIVNRIPQDHDESRAEVLPESGREERSVSLQAR